MAIPAQDMDDLVTALCRFPLEAADLARKLAPAPSLAAALETLRQATFLRDRESARATLRDTSCKWPAATCYSLSRPPVPLP